MQDVTKLTVGEVLTRFIAEDDAPVTIQLLSVLRKFAAMASVDDVETTAAAAGITETVASLAFKSNNDANGDHLINNIESIVLVAAAKHGRPIIVEAVLTDDDAYIEPMMKERARREARENSYAEIVEILSQADAAKIGKGSTSKVLRLTGEAGSVDMKNKVWSLLGSQETSPKQDKNRSPKNLAAQRMQMIKDGLEEHQRMKEEVHQAINQTCAPASNKQKFSVERSTVNIENRNKILQVLGFDGDVSAKLSTAKAGKGSTSKVLQLTGEVGSVDTKTKVWSLLGSPTNNNNKNESPPRSLRSGAPRRTSFFGSPKNSNNNNESSPKHDNESSPRSARTTINSFLGFGSNNGNTSPK